MNKEKTGLTFSELLGYRDDVPADEPFDAAHAGKVLVAVGPGDTMVLVADVAPGAHWLDEYGVREDGFACGGNGIDVDCSEPGLFIGNLAVVDDGEGDWPGTRECAVVINELRPVTEDEWRAHCRGEWPWGPRAGAKETS